MGLDLPLSLDVNGDQVCFLLEAVCIRSLRGSTVVGACRIAARPHPIIIQANKCSSGSST